MSFEPKTLTSHDPDLQAALDALGPAFRRSVEEASRKAPARVVERRGRGAPVVVRTGRRQAAMHAR
ncbi:hypothetical protein HL658_01605 [Azospirillum sp. RWY-5-1]|uniref:Uncharacterized protein n=1 Tax=Azospirillum oleiclasticum TaxID=2735135 RepID=A0ABX2T2P9_9PROT|nr:hypothetical protein [Azospirillum oleiclasticum]NYZ11230.1 hypothetical protein [Azospirillum oleiclasticum]NYZ18391.1 hypothetical protein [Azospirillum oleiclasticum]